MQRYSNIVQDPSGNGLSSVSVTVKLASSATLATLYSDNGSTSKANPFTNDADGSFEFYATNGRYDITLSKSGVTFDPTNSTDVALFDPLVSGTTYTSPIFSGTITGTYTLAGTPTLASPTITTPTFSGTYTLGGTPTVNAGLVTATGSTTARLLADRFAQEFHVSDYGAVCDGTTNDSTAIQAAITAAGVAGGRVVFPPKVCAIATGLTNIYNNVMLKGKGRGGGSSRAVNQDYLTAGTTLKWTGSAGGTMYDMGTGPSSAYRVYGGGIDGIFFEGNGVAAFGVKVRSVAHAYFDMAVEETTTVGVDIDVDDTVTSDPPDTQHNYFAHIVTIQESATGGIGVRLGGGTGANTSLNHFGFLHLFILNSVGLDIGQSDGNVFEHVQSHGANNYGMVFRAGTSPTHARDNLVIYAQTGGLGTLAEGTPSGTTASLKNRILHYSQENGAPLPVIQAGAILSYSTYWGAVRMSALNETAELTLHRANKTAAQKVGKVLFSGTNSADAEKEYATITGAIRTPTVAAEDGQLQFQTLVAGTNTNQVLMGDGIQLATPTGGYLGSGSLNASGLFLKDGAAITGQSIVTYSASMTPDHRLGAMQRITVSNGTAFTINNPTNSITGIPLIIMIRNASGGAHGAITWGAGYKMAGALPAIATGNSRSVSFHYDGTNWVELFRSAADVAN